MLKRYLISPFILLASITLHAEETDAEPQTAAQSQESIAATPEATDKTAFITDDLFTFLHAGAGKNYRILGSIDAGTQLTLVSGEEKNGFLEVIDDKERTGWVLAETVSFQPGMRQQQESLRNEMTEAQQQLRELQLTLPEVEDKNRVLSAQVNELQQTVDKLTEENSKLKSKQAQQGSKEKRQLLIYGGSIAFIGLFLGILLTVILSRRKRYDNWA